ncbi:MAG: T9SS type A sorting domain-containing protein [Sphingobacteriaceae bacterium]|nr:MAG: T9SS type A sorting domain-containing protein [Sphingobacteriaceae bacterium]
MFKHFILMYNLKKVIGSLILCIGFSAASYAQQQTPVFANVSDLVKAFYLYTPQGYPASGVKYPLIIFVHGNGEKGPGTAASLPLVLRNGIPKLINDGTFPASFTVNAQTFRFMVISPQFGGSGQPSVNDVNGMINYALANYPVDINRIYLTGLSMGGGVTWYFPGYNSYLASRIAAIVPVCGATQLSQNDASNIAASNLPVWATHNNGDPTIDSLWTYQNIALINNRSNPPNPLAKKTIFVANGHDAWTRTYSPAFKENGLNIYEWMLQYKRNFVVLPVTGLSFTAQQVASAKRIQLKWSTQTESNIAGFKILRSTDGINFNQINFVNASGAAGNGASYNYVDENPFAGKDFYRLEVQELNGSSSFSDIKMVALEGYTDIIISPNPVKETMNLQTTLLIKNASLQVFNSHGQQVFNKTINGTGNIPVNMAKLPPGIYSARITDRNQVQRLQFIKQ